MKIFVIERTIIRSFKEDRLDDVLSKCSIYGHLAFDKIEDAQNFLISIGCSPVNDGSKCARFFKLGIFSGSSSILAYFDILELQLI